MSSAQRRQHVSVQLGPDGGSGTTPRTQLITPTGHWQGPSVVGLPGASVPSETRWQKRKQPTYAASHAPCCAASVTLSIATPATAPTQTAPTQAPTIAHRRRFTRTTATPPGDHRAPFPPSTHAPQSRLPPETSHPSPTESRMPRDDHGTAPSHLATDRPPSSRLAAPPGRRCSLAHAITCARVPQVARLKPHHRRASGRTPSKRVRSFASLQSCRRAHLVRPLRAGCGPTV